MCEDKRVLVAVFKSKTIVIMSERHIVRLDFNRHIKFFGKTTKYKKQLIVDVLDIDDRRKEREKKTMQGRSISRESKYSSQRKRTRIN